VVAVSAHGRYTTVVWRYVGVLSIGRAWYFNILRHDLGTKYEWFPVHGKWYDIPFRTAGRARRFARRLLKAIRNPHSAAAMSRRLHGAMGKFV